MGLLRDDGAASVYVHDGPDTGRWVTYKGGVAVPDYFTQGMAVKPLAAALPTVAAPHATARAERVTIAGRAYAVIVSPQPGGALFKIKGTVDGRVYRAQGATESAALSAWAVAVVIELDLVAVPREWHASPESQAT